MSVEWTPAGQQRPGRSRALRTTPPEPHPAGRLEHPDGPDGPGRMAPEPHPDGTDGKHELPGAAPGNPTHGRPGPWSAVKTGTTLPAVPPGEPRGPAGQGDERNPGGARVGTTGQQRGSAHWGVPNRHPQGPRTMGGNRRYGQPRHPPHPHGNPGRRTRPGRHPELPGIGGKTPREPAPRQTPPPSRRNRAGSTWGNWTGRTPYPAPGPGTAPPGRGPPVGPPTGASRCRRTAGWRST